MGLGSRDGDRYAGAYHYDAATGMAHDCPASSEFINELLQSIKTKDRATGVGAMRGHAEAMGVDDHPDHGVVSKHSSDIHIFGKIPAKFCCYFLASFPCTEACNFAVEGEWRECHGDIQFPKHFSFANAFHFVAYKM